MNAKLFNAAKTVRLGEHAALKPLLLLLADYANQDGMAWPHARTLAHDLEKSENTIYRQLARLKTLGLITDGDQTLATGRADRRPKVWRILPTASHQCKAVPAPRPITSETTTSHQWDYDLSPVRNRSLYRTPMNPRERIYARAKEKDTTMKDRLDHWTPNDDHERMSERWFFDLDAEAEKFRLQCEAEHHTPINIDAAFSKWLHTGHENGYLSAKHDPTHPNTRTTHECAHTWRCKHVLELLGRDDHTAEPDQVAAIAIGVLHDGYNGQDARDELTIRLNEAQEYEEEA